MKLTLPFGSLAALCLVTSSCVTGTTDQGLASAVPSDFFMVVGSHSTPEQDFIQENWLGVHEAFEESGVMEDIFAMLPVAPDPAVMEHMESAIATVTDICADMCEGGLGKDTIFAQRLGLPEFTAAGNVHAGPPDMVLLLSVDPQFEDARFGDLLGLVDYGFEEIEAATGMAIELNQIQTAGIDFRVLDGSHFGAPASAFEIALGHHNGALVVTCGPGVREQVAALMTGKSRDSIANETRYQEAFASLPAAEVAFTFVDLQQVTQEVQELQASLEEMLGSEAGLNLEGGDPQSVMFFELGMYAADLTIEALAINDYTATVSYIEGHSMHTESIGVLSAGAEQNSFYPLVTSAKPVEDYARYLPESTISYAVKGGTDLHQLYGTIMGMVEGAGPMGQMALGQWSQFQAESGFDINRYVLDLVDGEFISATFTLDGEEVWVNRVKVINEQTAAEVIDMGLAMIPGFLEMAAQQNPMVGMLGITVTKSTDPAFAGFTELAAGMVGAKVLVGVDDGWIVFGSSTDAIEMTRATARGELPNVLTNAAVTAASLQPMGPANSVVFTNLTGQADAIADAMEGMGMMGGMMGMMIPDPEVAKVAGQVLALVAKLAPVVRAIDFFDSSASVSTFDGQVIRSHSVTNFVGE